MTQSPHIRLVGDVNQDDKVDITDLNTVSSHWQQHVNAFTNGDLDGDGLVTIGDLTFVANHWQDGVGWTPNPIDIAPDATQLQRVTTLFPSGLPVMDDVHQNNDLGDADCALLAGFIAMAHYSSQTIVLACIPDGHGGYTVKFGDGSAINVSPDCWISDRPTWAAIMEKAACWKLGNGRYSSLNFASASGMFRGMWGISLTVASPPSSVTFQTLVNCAKANKPVLVVTGNTDGSLVSQHCYALTAAYVLGGVQVVNLRNPWGFADQVGYPYSKLLGGNVKAIDYLP